MRRTRLILACAGVAAIAIVVAVASAAPPGGSNVSLSITDAAVAEGNAGTRALVFTVQAAGSLKGSASARYATADGSAVAPGDFAATSGTLAFDRRNKSRTVSVQIVGDTVDELDENFQVVLSTASGATIADGTGVGTIIDDDSPPVSGTKIAAAGDIACDPTSSLFNGGQGSGLNCRQLATSDLLVGAGYAAVLPLGDIQYEDGAYSKFLASYDPSWGRVKSITKPAPGNHEYQTSGAAGYYQYFAGAAGDPAKGYYSYDLGRLARGRTELELLGGCAVAPARSRSSGYAPTSPLIRQPARSRTGTIRASRRASHGSDSTYTALWQALYDANADVVLVGHDHEYERFAPQTPTGALDLARGIREFVVGTGGKEVRPFSTIRANSEARDAASLGVLELTLGSGAYEWRFRPAVGSFADTRLDLAATDVSAGRERP